MEDMGERGNPDVVRANGYAGMKTAVSNPAASRPGAPYALGTWVRHDLEGPWFPTPADRDPSFDGVDPFRPADRRLPSQVRRDSRVGYRGGSCPWAAACPAAADPVAPIRPRRPTPPDSPP